MTRAAILMGQLETATVLIAKGDFAGAETHLSRLSEDPDRAVLGPETALGMPRRLQSAWLKLAKAKGDTRARIALQYHLVPPPDLLGPLFKVDLDGLQTRAAAAVRPVPKVLHQIWIGPRPPETTEVWREHSIRHGWEYKLWDEGALEELGVRDHSTYRHMRELGDLPGAVDVARYLVLSGQGGLYLDCDWMPVRDAPLEQAIPLIGLSAIAERTPRLTGTGSPFLNNSVLAAPPGHPVFAALLSTLPEVIKRLPKGPAWWATGPLVFTLASRAGPITILDASIDAGMTEGNRSEVEQRIESLRSSDSPAFLCGWKPWSSNV